MIKVLVVDDHKMFADGIYSLLLDEKDIKVVKCVYKAADALTILHNTSIDIVLTDIEMPEMNGIELTKKIRKLYPTVAVIAVSMYSQLLLIQSAMNAGVMAYILKETGKRELIHAIRTVYEGKTFYSSKVTDAIISGFTARNQNPKSHYALDSLTKREQEIIRFLLKEYTNAEIAKALYISEHTVKTHRKKIMQKLEVKNVVGLVVLALKHKR